MWGRLKSKEHKLNYIKYIIKVGDNSKVHERYVKWSLKWKVRLTFNPKLNWRDILAQGTLGFAQVRVEVKFKVQVKKNKLRCSLNESKVRVKVKVKAKVELGQLKLNEVKVNSKLNQLRLG